MKRQISPIGAIAAIVAVLGVVGFAAWRVFGASAAPAHHATRDEILQSAQALRSQTQAKPRHPGEAMNGGGPTGTVRSGQSGKALMLAVPGSRRPN